MARARGVLDGVPLIAIEAELRRRKSQVDRLAKRREQLLAKLNQLNEQIRQAGGSEIITGGSPAGVRKRPKNEGNLEEALVRILKGRQLSVTEASLEVQKAGYRTNAANFRTIVNQRLVSSPKFRRIERGIWTAAA